MPTTNDPTKYTVPTGDKLIPWLEEKKDDARALPARSSKLNLAYVLGYQWVSWNASRRRLDSPRQTQGEANAPIRITVNKIGSLVERIIARLTKSSPVPECRPVTDTDSDINAAKVGTRILDHEMNRLQWSTFLTRLYFWVVSLGWSFVHIRWEPDAGPVVGELEGAVLREGEIVLEEAPGTEMRIDPNARTWVEAMWCVRTVTMTSEAVFEQYGKTVEGGNDHERSLADEVYSLAAGGNEDLSGGHGAPGAKSKKVAVHQFWLRPGGRANPKGLVATWCGKQLLEPARPFPYEHGHLPFVPFSLLPGVGQPEGRTWVDDLRSQQNDYNDARSREATIRRLLAPKLLAARGQIDTQRWTSRVEVIDYAPTGPVPTWLMPDGRWMSQYEQAMERADMEMGDRAGQAEVSQGRAPAGAPAAAILALQEADESKLAISAKELAASTSQVGWQILMLVREFWNEERIVRTWSQDGTLEVQQFSGQDLGQQLDVHLTMESALPRSKSARAQLAMDLWDRQILTDPRLFLRMLEVPGVGFLEDQFNADAAQAEREHGHLIKMEPVEAKTWHNHAAHTTTHDAFRKTEEYERLTPEQQQWFDGHIDVHYAMLQGQLGQPTPMGTPQVPPEQMGMGGANPAYMDPMTGMPPDPLAVAAGQAPSGLSINPPPGIGGPGQQGAVPGIPADQQLAQTGM